MTYQQNSLRKRLSGSSKILQLRPSQAWCLAHFVRCDTRPLWPLQLKINTSGKFLSHTTKHPRGEVSKSEPVTPRGCETVGENTTATAADYADQIASFLASGSVISVISFTFCSSPARFVIKKLLNASLSLISSITLSAFLALAKI